MMSAVRNFQAWLLPLNRTLWNAFSNRQGVEAPHAFCYKKCADLSQQEQSWGVGVLGGHNDDVMVCVKTYMHDQNLQQAPVLVLPHGRAAAIVQMVPPQVVDRLPLSEDQIRNYMKLSKMCENYGLHQAADAMSALVKDRSFAIPQLRWLQDRDVQVRRGNSDGGHPYFPHLPKTSFHLFARDVR